MVKFLPTFMKMKTGLPTFYEKIWRVYGRKNAFWPKKVGFCPVLKTKVGTEKPSKIKGLRAFCPLSHFFSLLIVIKSLKKYIN